MLSCQKPFWPKQGNLTPLYEEFERSNQHSELCRYLHLSKVNINYLKDSIAADWSGNWHLHRQSVKRLLPLFAECYSIDYLCYGSIYLGFMRRITSWASKYFSICQNISRPIANAQLNDCNWTRTQNPVWPYGWMFIYELSGFGFESSCSHLKFKFCTCFKQEVPRHSGHYGVWIHSEMRMWHDKNIQHS